MKQYLVQEVVGVQVAPIAIDQLKHAYRDTTQEDVEKMKAFAIGSILPQK